MVHILGAGIAGLLLAEELDKRGVSWTVYEKAERVGLEASGKNAGIIRSYETDSVLAALTEESLAYYKTSEPTFDLCGIAFCPWEIDYETTQHSPITLVNGKKGIFLANNGSVLSLEVLSRLVGQSYNYGSIKMQCEASVAVKDDCATLVAHGALVRESDAVVVACGEGAITITNALERPLRLLPHLRTIYEYENTQGYSGPIQWDEEAGSYFKTHGDILIATAGEQLPVVPRRPGEVDDYEADPRSPAILAKLFPALTLDALKGFRSCRRLMPLDNRPYCGRDKDLPNLFWFTGLGGRGMSIGPALAHGLADVIEKNEVSPLLEALSPSRIST